VFVAIGTSGSVQPVASFAAMLKQKPSPAKTLYLGLAEPANAGSFDEIRLGEASALVPAVFAELNDRVRRLQRCPL
jgi:NAD-dependent deacetylase